METHMKPGFSGTPGELMPVVKVEDLRLLWDYQSQLPLQTATGAGLAIQLRDELVGDRTDFDVDAISHRCTVLWIIQKLLSLVWTGGQLSEAAIKAAAAMKLK